MGDVAGVRPAGLPCPPGVPATQGEADGPSGTEDARTRAERLRRRQSHAARIGKGVIRMIEAPETAVGSMTTNSVPKNLVIKQSGIVVEVDRVPMRGRNEFHKYDYVMESDLVEAVRQKLAERHVFLLSSFEELRREDTLTEAKIRFTFLDGDTGESLS